MPKKTSSYQEGFLEDQKDPIAAVHHLNASLAESPSMFWVALRDVAAARKMANVAATAGVARSPLYRMLSEPGNPRLNNLGAVLQALGLTLKVDFLSEEYNEREDERGDGEELKLNLFVW